MGTELLLKASAESTSRFHCLLQDLLEEHEKQQSLLRRKIQRLGGEAFDASGTSGALGASGAGDALEVLDPERVDLEVPSERREDDVVLALTYEEPPSLEPLPAPKDEPPSQLDKETGSLTLPPIPATSSEILQNMKMDEAEEDSETRKGVKAVAFSSETSRYGGDSEVDAQTPKSKASALENKVYAKRDTWAMSTFGMEDDWSPQRYIMTSQSLKKKQQQNLLVRSTKTMELLPQMNCFAILKHGRPIPPSAPVRLAWDVTGLFLILYDICAIPLEAFEFERIFFQDFMDWAALLFWTLDVIFSFFTGYYHNGQLILDYWKIAINYLSTWFILDCAVIIPEWLTMLGSDSFAYAGIGRALRLGKAMRVVRLLRVLKLRRIIDACLEYIESEFTFLVISLLRLLFFIVLLNHVIACLWYLIGKESLAGEIVNWIEVGGYEAETATYKYFTSLHWALTQFTPASMDVSAKNVYERMFSIAVLFFAMVAFSSIVGGVTASMTQLQNLRSNHMKQFWMLRRYLKQNQVNKELQFRIEKFLEYRIMKEQEYVQPNMVLHLPKLSQPLRNELAHSIMVQWLRGHPFFHKVSTLMPNFMHKLCSNAIKEKVLGQGDIVFEAGEECTHIYFLSAGLVLEYTPLAHRSKKLEDAPSHRLQQKQWLSEPSLWVPWKHLGVCEAEKPGELISVDANSFCKEMSAHPAPRTFCASYARLYVECLNNLPKQVLSDVLDQHILDSTALVERASVLLAAIYENRAASNLDLTNVG